MKRSDFEIEVCVASIQSVLAAAEGGADRVELCDNLYEGGTTPSIGTLIQVKEKVDIDVFVMIRPRGGDFLYDDDEMEIMLKDIEQAHIHGADGFVFGCLKADGSINSEQCKKLIEQAKGLPVTFHRAFDMCNDPYTALEQLKSSGINRLLTSGLQNKAYNGLNFLAELVQKSKNSPKVMVGSGVNESNIQEIAKKTKAHSFHVTLREDVESQMEFRKEGIYMGGISQISEYSNKITSVVRLKKLIDSICQLESFN